MKLYKNYPTSEAAFEQAVDLALLTLLRVTHKEEEVVAVKNIYGTVRINIFLPCYAR